MEKSTVRTKRTSESAVTIRAPREESAKLLRGVQELLIQENRRRVKTGGERRGYSVALVNPLNGEAASEALKQYCCIRKSLDGVYRRMIREAGSPCHGTKALKNRLTQVSGSDASSY